ncbi:MAG: hypothetical protein M1343_06690 [Chloroflexi bacterium]|nr:hypothetical protein [Chloroflexota bacterium]MDA8189085.1 hypothetical protein [Dehalococcoidales bacterium]
MSNHGSRKLSLFNATLVVLAAILLAARLTLSNGNYGGASLYFLLEVLGSILGLGVVYVGIRGYLESGSKRLLLMGLAFFSFAVLDIPYVISSPGGLSFILPEDENVALWFWEAGRLLGSSLLLASVLVPETTHLIVETGWKRMRYAIAWPAAILSGAVLYAALLRFSWPYLPGLWDEVGGLTFLKTTSEWIAVFFQIGVALAYVQRYLRLRQDILLFFSLGTTCLGFTGIALTVHKSFYDSFFWVAQGYKMLAYVFFVLGVWHLSRQEPQQQIEREPLRSA